MEIKLYEKIENGGFGMCHLLKRKPNKSTPDFVYLFYSEEKSLHFIVCEGVSENGYFCYARYFYDLENALSAFNEI